MNDWLYMPFCQTTSRYGSVGGWPTTTASRCGGWSAAPSSEVMAQDEEPDNATCPFDHGWRAIHSTTSYTSFCSREHRRHRAPPLLPLPRTSVFTRA